MVMHDSGMPFNIGHPQRFVGALLHNAFPAGDKPSPKAKLPPAFLDHPTKFPIDSCIWDYWDWTTDCEDRSPPDKHFMWLSNEFTPFKTDLGASFVPLDFALGLPSVDDWLKRTGEVPWVLDPAKHPRPAVQSHHKSASPSSGDEKQQKRKKKKHRRPKKQELKVTTQGQGDDAAIWTNTRSNLSSSSESQTEGDSGIGSYQRPRDDAGSTTRHNRTPQYSPDTVWKLDKGGLEDAPLSDHGGGSDSDQEMVSGDDRAEEATGTDPVRPTRPTATITGLDVNLTVAPEVSEASEIPLLADTDDEKARRDTFLLIMQGFHATTRTSSDAYQDACQEVQTIIRRALQRSTAVNHTFVGGGLQPLFVAG